MPCPFTGRKMVCAFPNLCWTKNSFTFCARQKDDLHLVNLMFFITGPAQNILEPVEGQGIFA